MTKDELLRQLGDAHRRESEARSEADELMRRALAQGARMREVADAMGVSYDMVRMRRARDTGRRRPRQRAMQSR